MAEQQNFSATIDNWVDVVVPERALWVFRTAAQRVIEQMQTVGPSVASTKASIADGIGKGRGKRKRQGPVTAAGEGGHMPVDTGFLRASLIATLNAPNEGIRFKPENVDAFSYADGQVSMTILGARIEDVIYAVYTANYARHVEYGANGRAGYGFVRLAAQNWQMVVDEVVQEAKARAPGAAAPPAP